MEATPLEKARPLKGTRILLVEDDFFIRIDLEALFVDAGADVLGPCISVRDALHELARARPTVAILDVRLGCETVGPVAHELARRGVPFIFYTGQISSEAALAEWPDCRVLSKPALPKAIIAAVMECQRPE